VGKILDWICDILATAGALLLLFITFSIGYSIFTRQLNLHTPVWVVQFNEYALLWITFLGTAWLLSKDKHVSLPLVTQQLGERGKKVFALIHSIMGMGLCGVLCWFGAYTTYDHLIRKVIDVQPVDVPKGFILLVIPLGFFLLTMQFFRKFIVLLTGKKTDGTGEPVGPESLEAAKQPRNGVEC
jgi:TRAP-type C4-dicarboxylate transport system permease small subunit